MIVTTFNNLPLLSKGLRGYLRQSSKDFNLIIADDGSKDETRQWIDKFSQDAADVGIHVQHVWHEDLGFRRAMILNEAVRQSSTEPLIIFSDGDCIPPETFVENHIRVHEPNSFHVAGAYRLDQSSSETISERDVDAGSFDQFANDEHRKDLRRRWRKSHWGTLFRMKNRPKVLGLNLAIDRNLFEAVNGFDENFIGYGLEDSDLRDRVMRCIPRPHVKNLYGTNDVFHLWHPENNTLKRRQLPTWDYYQQRRPVRCEMGLTSAELERES